MAMCQFQEQYVGKGFTPLMKNISRKIYEISQLANFNMFRIYASV